MLQQGNGDVVITNDGATILAKMDVVQPAAKMLVELAKAQDAAAGDGTTSVTVLCGSLLKVCLDLLQKGLHPTVISDAMGKAVTKACEMLQNMAIPADLDDRSAQARDHLPPPCPRRWCVSPPVTEALQSLGEDQDLRS